MKFEALMLIYRCTDVHATHKPKGKRQKNVRSNVEGDISRKTRGWVSISTMDHNDGEGVEGRIFHRGVFHIEGIWRPLRASLDGGMIRTKMTAGYNQR